MTKLHLTSLSKYETHSDAASESSYDAEASGWQEDNDYIVGGYRSDAATPRRPVIHDLKTTQKTLLLEHGMSLQFIQVAQRNTKRLYPPPSCPDLQLSPSLLLPEALQKHHKCRMHRPHNDLKYCLGVIACFCFSATSVELAVKY